MPTRTKTVGGARAASPWHRETRMAIQSSFLSAMMAGLLGLLGLWHLQAAAETWQPGYYTLHGWACDKRDAPGPGCTKSTLGCMKIAAGPQGRLTLEVFSPQESGHVCGIRGAASLRGGKIVYADKDANGQNWLLELSGGPGGMVAFRYVDPPAGRAPFCGEHARLDGIAFQAIRQPTGAPKTCFEG